MKTRLISDSSFNICTLPNNAGNLVFNSFSSASVILHFFLSSSSLSVQSLIRYIRLFQSLFFCPFFSFALLRWPFSFTVCNSPSGYAFFNAFWARNYRWFFGRKVGSCFWWGYCGSSSSLLLLGWFCSRWLNRDFGLLVHNQLFVKFDRQQGHYESRDVQFLSLLLYIIQKLMP